MRICSLGLGYPEVTRAGNPVTNRVNCRHYTDTVNTGSFRVRQHQSKRTRENLRRIDEGKKHLRQVRAFSPKLGKLSLRLF
jgi:hypothetical protein